jgi:hypothetical protein
MALKRRVAGTLALGAVGERAYFTGYRNFTSIHIVSYIGIDRRASEPPRGIP